MAESVTVFEHTNENFYEIVWNARLQFVIQNLSHIGDVQNALTVFRQTDLAYIWGVQWNVMQLTEGGPSKNFYTGEVKLTPRDPEAAKQLFLEAEEASKKQIETILNHIHEDTDVIAELGAGYGGNLI